MTIEQTALVVGTLASATGIFLTLKLAWKRDKHDVKVDAVTTTGDSFAHITRAFADLNDSLSKENERYEARFETQEQKIDSLEARMLAEAEECAREIRQLQADLRALRI